MYNLTRAASLLCVTSLFMGSAIVTPLPASAQVQSSGGIQGTLIDQAGGVPVSNANVVLLQGTRRVATTKSAADGTFQFPNIAPGVYTLELRAEGYSGARSQDIAVTAGSSTAFRATLERASTNSSQLQEIGHVSSSSGRGSLSTSTTIGQSISGDLIEGEGYNRIGDALSTLPGANLSGLSSSLGDDISINIRGFGTSETQTLIDGHPIGPFGPGSGGFSFQDSPGFAIGKTVVTYGSGALGLYGTDSIGGTIDLQTLEPTRTPHASLTQGAGNLGKLFTDFLATGTVGKMGYAVVHAVEGLYGNYAPAQRLQNAGVGFDFSSATAQANTYSTSANFKLTNDLLKLRYSFDDKTQLTVSALSANSWDDKSGNGDNCYNTVSYQYQAGQQLIQAGPTTYPTGATPGAPGSITCTGSIAVNLNSGPACATAGQYAQLSQGYVPGGPGPWQAHRLDDFHARLTRLLGNNMVTVDGFTNRFTTDYNRNLAGGLDPTGSFYTGGFDSSFYQTSGLLVSDDISGERNDFGLGFYSQHQRITGDKFNNPVSYVIVPTPEYGLGLSSFFVRDNYRLSNATTFYLNGWLQHSTVTNHTTLDPRVSFVFKASPADVFRITGGRSTGDPSPILTSGPPNFNTTVQNLSHLGAAPLYLQVGSASNPGLLSETSTDFELAYGHRFHADTILQVDAYFSAEKNRIFSGRFPLSVLGPNAVPAALLAQYYAQVHLLDPSIPIGSLTTANLSVSTNSNAGGGRFQGIELSGRYRFNPRFYADYAYDIQSGVLLGVPDALLMEDPNVINGAQIAGLPLQKGSLGLDYSSPSGFEARIDTYFLGPNNGYGRIGSLFYSNASISKDLTKHVAVNLGIQNLFASTVSNVSALGVAPYVAENQFGGGDTAFSQGVQTYGLQPFEYTVSLTLKL